MLFSALENLAVSPIPPSPWHCYSTSMAQMVKNLPAIQETLEIWVWSLVLGRSPGGGHGSPLQSSCLENPIDRGCLRVTVQGVAKSQSLLSGFHSLHFLTVPLNLIFPWWLWFYFIKIPWVNFASQLERKSSYGTTLVLLLCLKACLFVDAPRADLWKQVVRFGMVPRGSFHKGSLKSASVGVFTLQMLTNQLLPPPPFKRVNW